VSYVERVSFELVVYTRGPNAITTNLFKVKIGPVRWMPLTNLSFDGMRFMQHAVELEVGQDLATFQRLVTEVAGDLWRKANPDRERLPKNFDQLTKLRFSRVEEGSATLPLEAKIDSEEESLFGEQPLPYLEQAVEVIIDAIQSQQQHRELPAIFPRQRISRVVELGQTLGEDESISIGDGEKKIKKKATLNTATRQRFKVYQSSNYEDVLTLYGDVRAVDLDGPTAHLRLPDNTRVVVTFTHDQEATFRRLLRQSVVLQGVAEISKMDGFIRSVRSVTEVSPIEPQEGEDALAVWLRTATVMEAWSTLPSDASVNLDSDLYGEQGEKIP
jgi:hypothetical protein